ncbi:aminomethyl transferase family protein [Cryptosporangium minutisporangium]|uniref:Aminomethyltransferase family protein n=1 Tax=Cryptosporangium minutisporangium TaxID=113569 RepID=A0ABP6SYE0_9ACTN
MPDFDWMGDTGGLTPTDTVQDGLDKAGGPMQLLWKPNVPPIQVPRVPAEFVGWAQEQLAWEEGVALLEVSHHMTDLFIEGPDAVRLLSAVSANNYQKFAVGQAKQLITVSEEGWLIQDAILTRTAADRFIVTGIGTAHNWIAFHAQRDTYDVDLTWDYSSDIRQGDPVLFRLQIQGPKAGPLIHKLFKDTLDDVKFFHYGTVSLDGREFYALRHGMTGQPGFEFFGPWEHHDFVRDALLDAGEELGIVQVGGRAYYTAGVDSGWLATPVPAIYTSAGMDEFRRHTSVFSYEGMAALRGSFYSPNIEDYYVNPYELGYGRSISFDHEFIGREALRTQKDAVRRTKVTLVWSREDLDRVFGADRGLVHSYTKDRVEIGSDLVGISEYAASSARDGLVHSIARVDTQHAAPGTEVTIVWGEHPGPMGVADPGAFQRIRAVVQPAPYNEYARTGYRDK